MIKSLPDSPRASQIPKILTEHGHERIDNYYWMRLSDEQKTASPKDEITQKVEQYLESENQYAHAVLAPFKDLEKEIYDEMVGRLKPDEASVPYLNNGYYYRSRFESEKEYPIYARSSSQGFDNEDIILNGNDLAGSSAYFHLGGMAVSPDNTLVCYGEDRVSRRIYTLKFKNIVTKEDESDILINTSGQCVWANDSKTLFYVQRDPQTLRAYKVYRHILGTDQADDVAVFHEQDESFHVLIGKSKSKKYIAIHSSQTLTNESWLIPADDPYKTPKCFEPRNKELKLEYSISHRGSTWYIITNLDAENFRLMACSEDDTSRINWREVVAHRKDVLLESIDLFDQYIVLTERVKGIREIRVMGDHVEDYYIPWPEEAHLCSTTSNMEMNADQLRLSYQSMKTPSSTFDFDFKTRKLLLLKQQEIVGGFDSEQYISQRLFAKARDGARVPISLVHHVDTPVDGTAPLLLYGYGSYGHSMDPYFSIARLSLLERGFVYAIAHIRGGEEMGRHWYEDGKLLRKKNTFNDFIDCGEFLIEENYCSKDKLFGMGGSAGGMLMGAVMNMRPDMWKGLIAAVPFVDVMTTMLDETIPLTTFEFDEWGNPKDKEYYDYMLSYSPIDNVKPDHYPALLVTTGYFDSQVQYWEPAKWIAKLREYQLADKPILFLCNMDAGHGGASGRYKQYEETAKEYAFLVGMVE